MRTTAKAASDLGCSVKNMSRERPSMSGRMGQRFRPSSSHQRLSNRRMSNIFALLCAVSGQTPPNQRIDPTLTASESWVKRSQWARSS